MWLHKTMNCFQLVKSVLDELYEQVLDEHGNDTDNIIQEKLEHLRKTYENLRNGVDVDYSDSATRFAYIYRYTTAHANMVYEFIRDSESLTKIFDAETVNVSCIGGGPGSDFLGILKFMDLGLSTSLKKLKCYLCDQEKNWRESWADVDDKLGTSFPFSVSTVYWELDVTDVDESVAHTKIFNADLFTMIYFISELYSLREDARAFFENMFDQAKPGALFLFVDNNAQSFYGWFDELAEEHHLECVKKENNIRFQTGGDEEARDLDPYYDKFGYPKLGANIAYRIYRKVARTTDLPDF